MDIDTSGWTKEGTFTATLIEALKAIDAVASLRVEDAPSSRADAGYAFISNEVFVRFQTHNRWETVRRFGIPWRRIVQADRMTLEELGRALGAIENVGQPDFGDAGMLQYLRAERIVPPYQTKGIKVVEMVRIYLAGAQSRQ
ncbi:MAG: hypothetical protein NT151_05185 [Acidobacteria bacterium]|nr:hypothetical protein [Acidobacteriota bacterium]